ncbi:hypothetical protein MPER_01537, partial [Moniliophthora perniciosa FA553]
MPSAMEMATADTCLRFFNETGVGHPDFDVLQYASGECFYMCLESLLGIDSPDCQGHDLWTRDTRRGLWNCLSCDRIPCNEVRDFIGKLRLDTVYSGAQLDKIAVLKETPAYTWRASSGFVSVLDPKTHPTFIVTQMYLEKHCYRRLIGLTCPAVAQRLA